MIAKNNQFVYTILLVYRFIYEYVNKNKRRLKTERILSRHINIKIFIIQGTPRR